MATKKTSKSSVSKKRVLATKKKKFSPGLKNKPKFSAFLLVILVIVLTGAGVYYIYNSFAATAEEAEPPFESEITEGQTATDDPAELAQTGGKAVSGETVNSKAFGTTTPWRTTTKKGIYDSSPYWKGANTKALSSCKLGSFKTISKSKELPIGKTQIRFQNANNTNVNAFVLIPDYQINSNSPRYINFEEHRPSFGTKTNETVKYTYIPNDKSDQQGYTSYVARLSGYYLYKTMTLRPGTAPAVWDYKLYRIKCGSKKVAHIKAPRAVSGAALVATARGQLGVTENPVGSNCGPPQKYQSYCGLSGCNQWCASFVSWVYGNTKLGLNNKPAIKEVGAKQYKDFLNTNASIKKYETLKAVSSNIASNKFAPGDIIIRTRSWTDGHVGMVKSFNGNKLVTIEGNGGDDKVSEHTYVGAAIKTKYDYYGHWKTWPPR